MSKQHCWKFWSAINFKNWTSDTQSYMYSTQTWPCSFPRFIETSDNFWRLLLLSAHSTIHEVHLLFLFRNTGVIFVYLQSFQVCFVSVQQTRKLLHAAIDISVPSTGGRNYWYNDIRPPLAAMESCALIGQLALYLELIYYNDVYYNNQDSFWGMFM